MQTITHAEWIAEAKRRFGDDPMNWHDAERRATERKYEACLNECRKECVK